MPNSSDNCPKCSEPIQLNESSCSTCGTALIAPNVRMANVEEERTSLLERYHQARESIDKQDLNDELTELLDSINEKASVVVAVPLTVALKLVSHPSSCYVNYEKLVDSNARKPAKFLDDRHRKVTTGALFGSIGESIVYGALSLSSRGLQTYGGIFCKLKQIAIEDRTSFLECNSYEFIEEYGTEGYPKGYRSDWGNKDKLAAIKLNRYNKLSKLQSLKDWEEAILVSDGDNRNLDEYIEGHIYGRFNIHSIEIMEAIKPIDKEKEELVKLILTSFDNQTN